MAKSPFYAFRNAILTFEIEATGSDTVDSSGNPEPRKKTVTLLCWLKPSSVRSDSKSDERYPGTQFTETMLKGYVVSPEKNALAGINVLDKTVSASYQGQSGQFTRTINLPDSVGAFLITGQAISGTFRLLGGQ